MKLSCPLRYDDLTFAKISFEISQQNVNYVTVVFLVIFLLTLLVIFTYNLLQDPATSCQQCYYLQRGLPPKIELNVTNISTQLKLLIIFLFAYLNINLNNI